MNKFIKIITTGNGKLTAYRFFIFVTLPFFFVLLYLSFKNHFHGYIDRDTASYIAIALKYQRGAFLSAVNGYWSPLYSWLLTPLLYTGIDPDALLAFINALSSLIILYQLFRIAESFSLVLYLNILLQLSFAQALAQFSFVNITPDLLSLVFIIAYLRLYLANQLFSKPFLTGLLGVLMYLSKYYAFGFFMAHICLVYLIERFVFKRKLLKPFVQTISVFLFGALLWAGCLYIKYHEVMLSYAGSYNHSITKTGTIYHEWELKGLVPPAPDQLFPWEDVRQVYTIKDWSPFENKESFTRQLSFSTTNVLFFFRFMNAGTRYGFYINLFILLSLLIKKPSLKKLAEDKNIKMMLLGLVYVSGYFLILLCNDRYIWLLYFLSALSIAYYINNVVLSNQKWWLHVLVIVLLIYCFNKKQFDILRMSFEKDWDSLPQNIELFKKVIKPGDRVASTEQITAGHFPIDTRCLYYGTTLGYKNDSLAMISDLRKYNIRYLITTDTATHHPPVFIHQFQLIKEPFVGIKLYELNAKTLDSLHRVFELEKNNKPSY